MAELMVVGFEGIHRAAEVLEQVQQLTAHWEAGTFHDDARVFLDDAVAVYRTRHGRLRLDHTVRPTPGRRESWSQERLLVIPMVTRTTTSPPTADF